MTIKLSKRGPIPFRSDSGDLYLIPYDKFDTDVLEYRMATLKEPKDEKTMLWYEEGRTGWKRVII